MPPNDPAPLPLTLCWHCDRPLDDAVDAHHLEDDSYRPVPGAVSLCMYCGAVAFFGEDFRLLPPTESQLDDLAKDKDFRRTYTEFSWARQYMMIKQKLLGYEAEQGDTQQ